jgi:hypothetical protein
MKRFGYGQEIAKMAKFHREGCYRGRVR